MFIKRGPILDVALEAVGLLDKDGVCAALVLLEVGQHLIEARSSRASVLLGGRRLRLHG